MNRILKLAHSTIKLVRHQNPNLTTIRFEILADTKELSESQLGELLLESMTRIEDELKEIRRIQCLKLELIKKEKNENPSEITKPDNPA